MEKENKKRIVKYQNGKVLVEFRNHLQVNQDEKTQNEIHSNFSKIKVIALDYSNGTGDKTISADLNLDPDNVKQLARDIQGHVKGEAFKLSEQKINEYAADENGACPVTKFTVEYSDSRNKPWMLSIEKGTGKAVRSQTGGTQIAPGSYNKCGLVNAYLSDQEARQMFNELFDFIRDFELIGRMQRSEITLNEKKPQ